MDADLRRLYDSVQSSLQTLRDLQTKKAKLIETKHSLGAQKSENELVKQELNSLEPSAVVFKLIGPALISQDSGDARSIIDKRLDYINGEVKRVDGSIDDFEKREEEVRTSIAALQKQMQERQQALSRAQ